MSRFMLRLRQVVHSKDAFVPAAGVHDQLLGSLGEWIGDESDDGNDEDITFATGSTSTQSALRERENVESYVTVEN